MTTGNSGSSGIESLLIVRLSAMGDVLHTLPAAEALREALPNAMIGWLVEERWADLLCAPGTPRRGPRSEARPLADWVHTVDLKGWRKSLSSLRTLEQIARSWNDVRSVGYDVAIDLQGAIRSALLARWSRAPIIYGAAQPREAPASACYTRQVITRGTHVIEQNLSIAESVVGRRLNVPAVQLPSDPVATQSIDERLADGRIQNFAILNPGAGWGAKRWPPERYGEVARELASLGLRSVVNCGPGEQELAKAVEAASKGAAQVLACTVSELIALTRRASLFVGGDTGPLHLTAALRVPVVAIFGPTDPARNGPFGTTSVVLRNPESQTTHARNVRPEEGMLEISVKRVVDAARTLLADTNADRGSARSTHDEAAHG